MRSIKKLPAQYALLGIVLALLCIISLTNKSVVSAQSTAGYLSGFAWSGGGDSNLGGVGYIKFNGTGYGVTVASDGTLGGFAWSGGGDDSHGGIGWINFGPNTCGVTPKIVGRSLTGFAQATVADNNGWDGCISLNGTTQDGQPYGPKLAPSQTFGPFTGFAWGQEVLGYIDFTGVTYSLGSFGGSGETLSTFNVSPNRARSGVATPITFTWTGGSLPAQCALIPSRSVPGFTSQTVASMPSGNVASDAAPDVTATVTLSQSITFTLTCGSVSSTVQVNIVPNYKEM